MSSRATGDLRLPDLEPVEGLDPGIERYVNLLRSWGVQTYESCEGGEDHAFPDPTVRFHGTASEGFRALAVALQHGLPVLSLHRLWQIVDGEPCGPYWELVFRSRGAS